MKRTFPILLGFFAMGFADIISTSTIRIKAECGLSDVLAGCVPMAIFVWFLLVSVPTGVLCGRIGRKRTVVMALFLTAAAMVLPLFAAAERFWLYLVSFSLIGIGNTMLQAGLPALLSSVVPPNQLTSRISLGQFAKALCCAVTPVLALIAAKAFGNWKFIFLFLGGISFAVGLWLTGTRLPKEAAGGTRTTACSCFAMLAHPYVLMMTVGIVFSVGADIGFAVAIPEYLKVVYKVEVDKAATGPTVYFTAKMIAAFVGSILFARISAAKCFPWAVGVSVLAVLGLFMAPNPTAFLVLVFISALGFANTFGMCMGLAIDRVPEKANEISALMVMAIAGGGLITFAMGAAQSHFGASGITCVLLACLLYLMGLGIVAARRK